MEEGWRIECSDRLRDGAQRDVNKKDVRVKKHLEIFIVYNIYRPIYSRASCGVHVNPNMGGKVE